MISEVIMPKMGQTMEEGTIAKWLKKEGDTVEKGEVLLEITTDKATLEIESYAQGILKKILAEEGEVVPVTQVIAYIGEESDELPHASQAKPSPEETPQVPAPQVVEATEISSSPRPEPTDRLLASPRAKKLAKEKSIDLKNVSGSGPRGRIVEKDILNYTSTGKKAEKEVRDSVPLPLSSMRKIIAERMTLSKTTTPHFYLKVRVDMTACVDLREKQEKRFSYNDLIVKAVALSIKEYPQVGWLYTEEGFQQREEINVGLAVALDDGLIVPVLKDADKKNLEGIAAESSSLIEKAKQKKLTPGELKGGVFTITNLGMFDVDEFSAIVNPGESAILAIGKISEEPVSRKGKLTSAKLVTLTLSCDHRIIDGVLGAQFLQKLKELLENPDKIANRK